MRKNLKDLFNFNYWKLHLMLNCNIDYRKKMSGIWFVLFRMYLSFIWRLNLGYNGSVKCSNGLSGNITSAKPNDTSNILYMTKILAIWRAIVAYISKKIGSPGKEWKRLVLVDAIDFHSSVPSQSCGHCVVGNWCLPDDVYCAFMHLDTFKQ